MVAPGQAAGRVDMETCAGCHSRRENLTDGNPLPGTPYHDSYTLAILQEGQYHPDGQILDEVYVYGSFLQSKMYARGVTCVNCHDPHRADLRASGNAVCTQCHSPAGNADFPALRRAEYDSPDHHHHQPGSPGAQCKSCHMAERVYMGIDGRRDHSFRIPRPDLADQSRSPDACTDCHSDRAPAWAAAAIAGWFPDSDRRGPHFGTVIAQGRAAPAAAADDLRALALDPGQPGIARATALYLLQGQADADLARATAPLLGAADPLLRAHAAVLQRGAAPDLRARRLLPALTDPILSVRIAAARAMLDIPPQAQADWQGSLTLRLDYPETHLVLGGMALSLRNARAAEAAFGEVVRLDPQRAEAWPILVRITRVTRGDAAARAVLRAGLSALPDHPGLRRLAAELGG